MVPMPQKSRNPLIEKAPPLEFNLQRRLNFIGLLKGLIDLLL